MHGTFRPLRSYLVRGAVIAALSLIALYTLFEFRHLLAGPELTITYPENGASLREPLLRITGTARNVTHLTLNDRQIFVDAEGNLEETVLLSTGYNAIRLRASDRFGRVEERLFKLMVTQDIVPTPHAAPSS